MIQNIERTNWRTAVVVLAAGVFALSAQALLLRVFLSVFEGSELAMACFFSSWLAWVAIGAACGRPCSKGGGFLVSNFEFLPFLYIPAYLLQWWLICRARELTGVLPYEVFPLKTMVSASFLCSAPVSFCTGFLFTLACGWVRTGNRSTVARVYVWESLGGVIGGAGVTLLLSRGMTEEPLFLWATLLLALAFAACRSAGRQAVTAALPALAVVLVLCSGLAGRWERANNLRAWERILPAASFRGSFATSGATYLYGEYGGQFNVVTRETVADVVPATEQASEIIAIHLAQRPAARRFLVAGRGGLSICRRLVELPQVDQVTWLDADPSYPPALLEVLPGHLAPAAERIDVPGEEMRRWLARSTSRYDVVILNMPDATTLALNRYFTREFFLLLKERLSGAGVVGVRVSAGENFMSSDRVSVGATVLATLRSVFTNVVIKPGEESWLMASEGPGLTTAPAVLRDRFAAIEGATRIYPPAGLMGLYLPRRVEYEMQCYEEALKETSGRLLMNTDLSPRALLHGLVFAARETGGDSRAGGVLRSLALHGAPVIPVGILLFALLRCVFLLRRPAEGPSACSREPGTFDTLTLVFTTGAAGMGCSIVLMYMYQSAFGSIFLHVGLIAAVYMLGLSIGSAVSARGVSAFPQGVPWLLYCAMVVHVLLFAAILLLARHPSQFGFAVAFLSCGFLGGVYVPFAARFLAAGGASPAEAGSWIEQVDHLGGAAGGLLTGLVLLPLFGTPYGLSVLVLLLGSSVLILVALSQARWRGAVAHAAGIRERSSAAWYVLFGVAAFVMASAVLLRRGAAGDAALEFKSFAQSVAGNELTAQTRIAADGAVIEYFTVMPAASPGETRVDGVYIFRTGMLAPDVSGYGGPLELAIAVQSNGIMRDITVLRSRETPAYLESLGPWMHRLAGQNLFVAEPMEKADAVTGATMTSAAVLAALRKAGPAFGERVLGVGVGPGPGSGVRPVWPVSSFLLTLALVLALVLRVWPSRRWRMVFLGIVVVVFGVMYNAQYSMAHVLSLLGLSIPPAGWGMPFLLAVGIPAVVVLFGNIYCGYLCPFGAFQELVGTLKPRSLRTDPDKKFWAYGRAVKYLLLALVTVLFATTMQAELASGDPLVTAFARERRDWLWGMTGILLVLGFFYPRFWCRNLCPAGAFLALMSRARLVRRVAPAVVPRACMYGVRNTGELDCLCCDRCREGGRPAQSEASGRTVNGMLLAVTTALAVVLAAFAIVAWRDGMRAVGVGRGAEMAGRGARPADTKRLRRMVEQGRLSGRDALYYKVERSGE